MGLDCTASVSVGWRFGLAATDRLVRESAFDVAARVRDAWELFTPNGRRLWDLPWRPTYADAAGTDDPYVDAPVGTVFETIGPFGDRSVWVLTALTEVPARVRYLHTIPQLVGTEVDVQLSALAPYRTRVRVVETLAWLSDRGRRLLQDFGPAWFGAFHHPERAIAATLAACR